MSDMSDEVGMSRYEQRKIRLVVKLEELTDVLYGRRESKLKGRDLRETIFVTLEALPKAIRHNWLGKHRNYLEEKVKAEDGAVSSADVERCPKRSLVAAHYRDDGTCRCDEEAQQTEEMRWWEK